MATMTWPGIALVGTQVLVGVVMAGEGIVKLLGHDSQVEGFARFGYPQWFRVVVGGLETTGGVILASGTVAGAPVTLLGTSLIGVVLLGALGSHARVGDPLTSMAPAGLLLVVTLAITAVSLA